MMSQKIEADICVIGGGSGGLSVAAGASQMGSKVVLFEAGKMGGDCLNYGCVPSKAILAAGKTAHAMRHSERFGISPIAKPDVTFQNVHDHVHDVIAGIAPHDSVERFEGLGVQVIQAHAKFVDERTVEGGGFTVTVSYTHLRAHHETVLDLVCRLLLEKKNIIQYQISS